MTAGETPGGGAAASAIELLSGLRGLESEGIRQALLLTAGLDGDLVAAIPTGGSTPEFAAAAVEACLRWAGPGSRRPPVVALLEASAAFGDAPYEARMRGLVDELLRELESPRRQWQIFLERLGLSEGSMPGGPPPDVEDGLGLPDADRAEEILAREHAVVLLGEPHADPTPTALRLLWRAFREPGLEPRWLTTVAFDAWVQEPGALPRQVDKLVPNAAAVHIQDPFGATTPTDLEQFLTDLRDLAGLVAPRNGRLIVTSTSPVFSHIARTVFPGLVAELPPQPSADADGDRVDAVGRWPPERLLAVLVVDLLADSDASAPDAEALYRVVVDVDADDSRTWDAALAEAQDDVVDRAGLHPFPLQLREPGLRDVLRRHVEGSREAADLSQRLVARAAAATSLSVRLAALRALLRQPVLWRSRAWAAPVLDGFLNSPDTLVRREARFTTIAGLPDMPADLRATIVADARRHWNDRFLLRLALHGDLTAQERPGLVGRLARSWDRWVRSVTARNLHHLGADPAALSLLLRDEDRQIAREAARALLAHPDAWTRAAAVPADLLTDELRRDQSIRPLLSP